MLWQFSTEQWLISFSFICTCSFMCGWLADRIVGYSGFTAIGNWILLLVGAYVGLYTYNVMGYRFYYNPTSTIIVAFGSGLALFFTMLSAKAVLQIK